MYFRWLTDQGLSLIWNNQRQIITLPCLWVLRLFISANYIKNVNQSLKYIYISYVSLSWLSNPSHTQQIHFCKTGRHRGHKFLLCLWEWIICIFYIPLEIISAVHSIHIGPKTSYFLATGICFTISSFLLVQVITFPGQFTPRVQKLIKHNIVHVLTTSSRNLKLSELDVNAPIFVLGTSGIPGDQLSFSNLQMWLIIPIILKWKTQFYITITSVHC